MNKIILLFTLFISNYSLAILTTNPDSIRGALRPERLCFDVTSYDLSVTIDPGKKIISGQNDIYFTCLKGSKTIQIDLFRQYEIKSIYLYVPIDSTGLDEVLPVTFKKVEDALFISFTDSLIPGDNYKLRV